METLLPISSLWLFPIAFAVSYLVTRKDLALACTVVGVISAEAFHLDPEQWNREQVLTVVIMCNLSLASISAVHYFNHKQQLARCMCWISLSALLINLIQAFEYYEWTSSALLLAQFAALLSIVSLDGSREVANGMAASAYRFVSYFSGNHGSKGSGKS